MSSKPRSGRLWVYCVDMQYADVQRSVWLGIHPELAIPN
jgi:hypothetical protein